MLEYSRSPQRKQRQKKSRGAPLLGTPLHRLRMQGVSHIMQVFNRIFTRILAESVQEWTDDKGYLSRMQREFRKGRRGDDRLFILTSAIELSR